MNTYKDICYMIILEVIKGYKLSYDMYIKR